MAKAAGVVGMEALEARLHAGRGVGKAPALAELGEARKLYGELKKAFAPQEGMWPDDLSGRGARAALEAKARLLAGKPPDALDLEQEAAAWHLLTQPRWISAARGTPGQVRLVQYWIAAGGLAFAVRARAAAARLDYRFDELSAGKAISVKGARLIGLEGEEVSQGALDWKEGAWALALRELRARLGAAEEAEHEAARAAAAEARRGAPAALRAELDYLFPAEAAWSAEDAAALLAQPGDLPPWAFLVAASLRDPDLAVELAFRGGSYWPLDWLAPALVASGAALEAPLIAAWKAASAQTNHAGIWGALEALAHLATPAAADLMVDRLVNGDKYDQERVAPWFERAPALALPRLEAAAERSSLAAATLRRVRERNPDLVPDAAPRADTKALPPALRAAGKPAPLSWYGAQIPVEPVRLRDGAQLPPAAVDRLVELLQAGSPDLDKVIKALDPASFEDFALALFESWAQARLPTKDKWIAGALAWAGGPRSITRLGAWLRSLSGTHYHPGLAGLDALRRIGTRPALLQVAALAQKAKSNGLKKAAAQALSQIAAAQKLTPQQLADRLIPDLGLSLDGTMELDYGPRRFRVGFDARLRPLVEDAQGGRLRELPKPGKADDAAKAKAAQARWSEARKDAAALAPALLARLEGAMRAQQRWSAADFRADVLAHPLLRQPARGLVWGVYGPDLRGAFWIDADGSLRDAADEPFPLPDRASVGIAHPLHLPAADLDRWRALFADARIEQPFAQLDRPVYRPGSPAVDAIVQHLAQTPVAPGKLQGLIAAGWRRGPIEDNGYFYSAQADNITVRFPEGASVAGASSQPSRCQVEIRPGADPLAFSERVRELAALA